MITAVHHCPSFPCPLCHPCCCPPPGYQGLWPGYSAPVQQGCICPPGAEKTCQGPACPASRSAQWLATRSRGTKILARGAMTDLDRQQKINRADFLERQEQEQIEEAARWQFAPREDDDEN